MVRRILTAVLLIPLLVAAIYLLDRPFFLILLMVLLLVAARELSRLLKEFGGGLSPLVILPMLALPWLLVYSEHLLLPFLLGVILVILPAGMYRVRELEGGFALVASDLLGVFYLALPLSIAALLQSEPDGMWRSRHDLILVLMTVWLSDSAAYFVGRAWGRKKVTPRLSPNKSLEGFAAAIGAPLVLLPVVGGLLVDRPLWFFLLAALLISAAATLGDLFESMLKRGAHLKDTSALLPGHGGFLDRIDSLLFALPAYYLMVRLLELGLPGAL